MEILIITIMCVCFVAFCILMKVKYWNIQDINLNKFNRSKIKEKTKNIIDHDRVLKTNNEE
jgi:uncharacterized membrane protein YwzB